jgi:hypothetical protein
MIFVLEKIDMILVNNCISVGTSANSDSDL